MTNKLETTKFRLSYYLKNKGIKIQKFLSDTGIKRGFLDSDKMEISVTDENLAKIFAVYKDISPIWLITGNGSMLKSEEQEEAGIDYKQIAETQEKLISSLEKQIERLERELAKRDARRDVDAGCAGADMSETA